MLRLTRDEVGWGVLMGVLFLLGLAARPRSGHELLGMLAFTGFLALCCWLWVCTVRAQDRRGPPNQGQFDEQ